MLKKKSSNSNNNNAEDALKDSNVRVAVRIRPLLPKEIATNAQVYVQTEKNMVHLTSAEKSFT
jgi:hypothetical protein